MPLRTRRTRPTALASCATTLAFAVGVACQLPAGEPTRSPAPEASTSAVASPVDAGVRESAAPSGGRESGLCSLTDEGVTFTPASCQTCMQSSCCDETLACFVGNAACATLYSCINACPSRGLGPGSGTGTGAGDGGAGGGGGGDAAVGDAGDGGASDGGGDLCVSQCEAAAPAEVASARAYIKCYASGCAAQCK